MDINPEEDGITHINVYSKAKTELGRMLSNFYKYPIVTTDGNFLSVEGYWYWISLPECEQREKLRTSYGFYAKSLGQNIIKEKGRVYDKDFNDKIKEAIRYKFFNNSNLLTEEYYSLPLLHYYNYGGNIIDASYNNEWVIKVISDIREDIVKERIENDISLENKKDSSSFYLIVAGSRTFDENNSILFNDGTNDIILESYTLISTFLDRLLSRQKDLNRKIVIICGDARGVDNLANYYARDKDYTLIVEKANWDIFGKRAGMIRNEEMYRIVKEKKNKGVVLFWDGKSRGTKNHFLWSSLYNVDIKCYNYIEKRWLTKDEIIENQKEEYDMYQIYNQ